MSFSLQSFFILLILSSSAHHWQWNGF